MLPTNQFAALDSHRQFHLVDCHYGIVSKLVCRIGLAAILLLTALGAPCQAQWIWKKNGGSHNWDSGGSWAGPSGSPNSLTAIANINNNISSNQNIILESSVSVGTMNIGDSGLNGGVYQTFTIQPFTGTQTLTLGSGGIFSSNSVNTINSNMILAASTSIQHTNTSGSLNLNGNLNLGNRVLTVSGSGNTFIAGAMTGTGSLIKTGAGSLTLTGANNYSGGTTVSAGSLKGNTTSLQGAILNNSNVVFDQTAAGTYAGAMSGTGSLVKTSAGNLTLSGINSYSGGTTVSAGTLTGTTTSLQGAIVNSATVVFDQAVNGTYSGNMKGSGQLLKTGTGNVTLSGVNTYIGGTTVSAGTLTGTTASLQGQIINNSVVTFDQATAGTYAGLMTGSGSLEKTGAGNLTLTGINNYSGGTNVSAGILTGNTTSLQGAINNNSVVTFDQASAGTYAGAMNGSGLLVKTGLGNLTLAGANSFSGGTTISAGTLTGNTTSLQGAINNNSVVTFDQASAGTHAGAISGTGSFVKTGAGNLTLTGFNSYSGGTTVSAGTLTGTTNSLQGAINNNASVTFSQATSGTYSGAMGGTGSLFKNGAGSLTLSGNNSYSGGTTVDAGSLIGTTSSIQGAVTNTSAIVFNQSTNGTYAGVIGGSGSLTKSGSGTVTFSSGQNYLGDTFVTGGTLRLNNGTSLASSLIQVDSGAVLDVSQFSSFGLNSGQTLTGAGQVLGSLTQSAGSVISPGSSPGTLNFTGDVTLLGGSSYLWEINDATGVAGGPTGWDLFTTSGSLIIGADSSNPYLVNVDSLLPSNSAGDVVNFDPFATYDWEIAFAGTGITGFDSSAFVIDASGFTNDLSSVTSYSFSILQNGNSLYLRYAAVPEPSALLIIGLLTMGVALFRQPRRQR